MSDKQHYTVTLETDFAEPALTAAAFDLLRLNARACGLPDIGRIYVHLEVEVAGRTYPGKVTELRERLERLWLVGVTKIESTG